MFKILGLDIFYNQCVITQHKWCSMHKKSPYAIYRQRRPRSACTFMQADQGPLTESMDTGVYVDNQTMLRLDVQMHMQIWA